MAMNTHAPAAREGRLYHAPALEKGLDVIELLAAAPQGLSLSEIARGLGRSLSEIFRVIVVLDRRKWLRRDPGNDRYSVTYHALDCVQRATPARTLAEVAAPLMIDLTRRIGQSCHLAVRSGTAGMVLHREESDAPAGFAMRVGATIDLATSCSGHVLLAFLDPARADALITELPRLDADGRAQLRVRLGKVRKRGFERQPSARTKGVTDISYPIFGFDGQPVAALTVPYLVMLEEYQTPGLDSAQQELRATSLRISADLGSARL
jgi:DNA-binding IclR family transcriptional regulator